MAIAPVPIARRFLGRRSRPPVHGRSLADGGPTWPHRTPRRVPVRPILNFQSSQPVRSPANSGFLHYNAQQLLIEAWLEHLTSEVNLYKALGGGWHDSTGKPAEASTAAAGPA